MLFRLITWGSNQYQQILFEKDIDQINTPEILELFIDDDRIPSKHSGIKIYSGGGHSGLLLENSLILWGWNDDNQLSESSELEDRCYVNKYIRYVSKNELKGKHEGYAYCMYNVIDVSFGHSNTLILLESGGLLEFGVHPLSLKDKLRLNPFKPHVSRIPLKIKINKISAGVKHSAAISETGQLYSWGDNSFGQCPVDNYNRDSSSSSSSSSSNEVGGGEIGGAFSSPDGGRFVDVGCGLRNTIMVTSTGRIYSVGDNRYGTLGRRGDISTLDSTGERERERERERVITGKRNKTHKPFDVHVREVVIVTGDDNNNDNNGLGLDTAIIWLSVSVGWSHVIAKGKCSSSSSSSSDISFGSRSSLDKEAYVFYGWGRNDMAQLGYDGDDAGSSGGNATAAEESLKDDVDGDVDSGSCNGKGGSAQSKSNLNAVTNSCQHILLPRPLYPLDQDKSLEFDEVWCGSEYTIARDKLGYLWSTGWNEHGNLGIGEGEEKESGGNNNNNNSNNNDNNNNNNNNNKNKNNPPTPRPAAQSSWAKVKIRSQLTGQPPEHLKFLGLSSHLACGGAHVIVYDDNNNHHM